MLVIGVGLVFLGYSVGFWSYCAIRGYNVTLPQILSPKGPPGGQQDQQQGKQQGTKPAKASGTATTRGQRPVRGAF